MPVYTYLIPCLLGLEGLIEWFTNRTNVTRLALKGLNNYFFFTCSPVNGSMNFLSEI